VTASDASGLTRRKLGGGASEAECSWKNPKATTVRVDNQPQTTVRTLTARPFPCP